MEALQCKRFRVLIQLVFLHVIFQVTSAALTASVTASYDGDCACPSENPITFTCNVTGAASVTWEHPSFGDISFSSGSSLNQPLVRGIFTVTLVSREVVGGALDYVTTLTADSIDSVNDTELVCRGYNLIGTVNMTDSVTVCVKDPPTAPTITGVVEMSPSSVNVTFRGQSPAECVDYYTVVATSTGEGIETQCTDSGGSSITCTTTTLAVYSVNYTFTVATVTGNVSSSSSEPFHFSADGRSLEPITDVAAEEVDVNEIRVTWSAPSNGEDALTEFCISIDATAYYTGSTATSVTVSAADLGLMDPLPSCETYTVTVTPRAVIPGLIEGSAGSGSLITGQGRFPDPSIAISSCSFTNNALAVNWTWNGPGDSPPQVEVCSISATTECYDDADIESGNSLPLVYSNADLYDGTAISLTVSYSTTTCFSNASLTTQFNNIVSAVVDSGKIIAKTVSGAGSDGPRQSCEIDDLENLFVCIDYHSFKLDNPSVQETVSASMQLSLDGALQQLRSFSPGTTVHANITVRRSSCNPSSPTLGWPISLAFTTPPEDATSAGSGLSTAGAVGVALSFTSVITFILGVCVGVAVCYCLLRVCSNKKRRTSGTATTAGNTEDAVIYDMPTDPVDEKKRREPDTKGNVAYGVVAPLTTSPNEAYELVEQ